jgi:hypothetical protein
MMGCFQPDEEPIEKYTISEDVINEVQRYAEYIYSPIVMYESEQMNMANQVIYKNKEFAKSILLIINKIKNGKDE